MVKKSKIDLTLNLLYDIIFVCYVNMFRILTQNIYGGDFMADKNYNDIFGVESSNQENSLAIKNNGFFDILKVRMGEYKEFKIEQKNQRAVEAFQNMMLNSNIYELSKSTVRNTPFDNNVTLDETKYQF